MPYYGRTLPDICKDVNGCGLCETYLICWQFVEPHEPQRVRRQFGRFQHIPELVDRRLGDEHYSTHNRRGKSGYDWSQEHKFFIDDWETRYERFQLDFSDYFPQSMTIPMISEYMEWYNRITVSYITPPGLRSTVGMNETASSTRLMIETLQRVWHMTEENDRSPRMRQIREFVGDALLASNQEVRMHYPSSQHTDLDMSQPFTERLRRTGRKGVRTGGHGYTRQYRMSQQQQQQQQQQPVQREPVVTPVAGSPMNLDDHFDWEEHFRREPEQPMMSEYGVYLGSEGPQEDPPAWSHVPAEPQQPLWNARATTGDSFFEGVQVVAPEHAAEEAEGEGEEEAEGEGEEEAEGEGEGEGQEGGDGRGFAPETQHAKASEASTNWRSTRPNKGKKPEKYTPSK